jgi:hypothetical protein
VTGSVAIVVHTGWYVTALDGQTVTISDSSTGGGTADSFQVGAACFQDSTPIYYVACSNYVCHSSLGAGNWTLTSTASPTGGESYFIDAEIISGAASTGCHDQTGTWSGGSSPLYTYTGCVNGSSCPNGSAGQISASNELAIGFIFNGFPITPVSPFIQLQSQSAYMQNPTQGSALEVQWTGTTNNYAALIDTFVAPGTVSTKIRHSVKQQ